MPFVHDLLWLISGIVEVNGGHFDVRVKSVLVEQYGTSSKVGHVKMIRQKVVFEVLNCFLQGDDMPFSRNVFLNGAFFPSSWSRIPAQNAESPLVA